MAHARTISASLSIMMFHAVAAHSLNAQNASQKLPQVVVDMVNAQVQWESGLTDPTRPHLDFVRFEEVSSSNGHFSRFRVFGRGLPEGKQYALAIWKIGTAIQNMQKMSSPAYVNRKGLLMTRKPSATQEDVEATEQSSEFDVGVQAANGEPIRFALLGKDSKVLAFGTLVPYPLESSDKSCRLSALLSSPEAEIVIMTATGFAPNTNLMVKGDSAGELKQSEHKTDANGRVVFAELPFVVGKESGTLTDTIATPTCSVSVQIPWGKGSYHKH